MRKLLWIPVIVIGFALFGLPLALLEAFVISTLWKWFIVPVFAVPVLSMAQAYGIGLLVAYITHRRKTSDKEEQTEEEKFDELVGQVVQSVFYTGAILGVGYVATLFL